MTYDAPADPARDAMASPEALHPTAPVHVVGAGPGNPDYLTPLGERRLAEADVAFGFESALDRVRSLVTGEALACGYDDEGETLARFADAVADGARGAVVMTGDPNVSDYQLLGKVERAVDRPVRVVPGVSSVQVAASRARTPLEETTFVTLHKRGSIESDLARIRRDAGERHLLVLPRPYDWMPGDLAAHLLDHGADASLESLVYEHLTREAESVTRSTLGSLADARERNEEDGSGSRFSDLSVLVVRRPAREGARGERGAIRGEDAS